MSDLSQVSGFHAPAAGGISLASPGSRISGREKAAIIVRLLLSEGASLPLDSLPERLQTALTTQMAEMPSIDRTTVREVVEEFCARLDAIGLSFPGGIDGALLLLDGHISPSAAQKLRKLAGSAGRGDPWERIAAADPERLVAILGAESVEVGAVILSKLSVPRAAELLGRLPGDRARRIAFAISQTGNVDPDTVLRIGQSVAAEVDNVPPRAFDTGPVERVGAILNHAAAMTRDDVLIGLDDADKGFADAVRKAIFTFANIPARINPRDVPKIVRAVDQPILVTALAFSASTGGEIVEFILGNMSQRLAAGIRDEMEGLGPVKEKDGEAAKGMIVAAIRDLESSGEIFMVVEEEE